MKKQFIVVYFLLYSIYSSAQVVIYAHEHQPEIGDYFEYVEVEKTLSVGSSGINKIWDFSSIDTSDSRILKNHVVGSGNHPSHINIVDSLIGMSEYKMFSDSTLTFPGYNYDTLENPLTYLVFPLHYNDQFNDIGFYHKHEMYSDGTVKTKRNINADAWGNIVLPNGNEIATLRVVTTDSIFYDYCGQGGCGSSIKVTTEYAWYSSLEKLPVFLITKTHEVGYPDIFTSYKFMNEENVATHYFELPKPSIYPTLFSDYIGVMNARGNYSIYSISGENMLTGKINSAQYSIDASSLTTGMYFLSIKNEGGETIHTEKLIKN